MADWLDKLGAALVEANERSHTLVHIHIGRVVFETEAISVNLTCICVYVCLSRVCVCLSPIVGVAAAAAVAVTALQPDSIPLAESEEETQLVAAFEQVHLSIIFLLLPLHSSSSYGSYSSSQPPTPTAC